MAIEDLVKYQFKKGDDRAKNAGRKGGKKSANVRAEKKKFNAIVASAMNADLNPKQRETVEKVLGPIEESEATNFTLMLAGLFKSATVDGNVNAFREIVAMAEKYSVEVEKEKDQNKFAIRPENFTVDFLEPYRQAKAALEPYRQGEDRSKRLREIISKGGRGSIKSSFWSSFAYEIMMNDPEAHVVFTRRFKTDLKDSVWSQWIRTVHRCGNVDDWAITSNPMRAIYIPTGQIVFFASADKPVSKKSFETPFGYIKLMVSEECDEMRGIEQLDNLEDTFLRKDTPALSIKIFNPPKSKNNFMNAYAAEQAATSPTTLVCHSYYYNVPVEWLGQRFFDRAEEFRIKKPTYYDNNYLGNVTGTGGEIFRNVTEREITAEEISNLPTYQGIDWGYEHPQVFIKVAYDRDRDKLYILHETYRQRTKLLAFLKATARKNRKLDEELLREHMREETIADRDPNKNSDARDYGWNIIGATKKWKGGGRDYSWEWLQEVGEIIVNPAVTPNVAKELRTLEHEIVKSTGEYSSKYPDIGEDGVMAIAYSLNRVIMDYKRASDYNDYEFADDEDFDD